MVWCSIYLSWMAREMQQPYLNKLGPASSSSSSSSSSLSSALPSLAALNEPPPEEEEEEERIILRKRGEGRGGEVERWKQ